jgi:hypothetical protein
LSTDEDQDIVAALRAMKEPGDWRGAAARVRVRLAREEYAARTRSRALRWPSLGAALPCAVLAVLCLAVALQRRLDAAGDAEREVRAEELAALAAYDLAVGLDGGAGDGADARWLAALGGVEPPADDAGDAGASPGPDAARAAAADPRTLDGLYETYDAALGPRGVMLTSQPTSLPRRGP